MMLFGGAGHENHSSLETKGHADDYYFVSRENTLFHEAITDHLAPNAWWINPKQAAIRANNKLLQLKKAVACGMNIPTSLFSNNPEDIREFVKTHKDNGVIYKPLFANFWFEENKLKITYTSLLRSMLSDYLLPLLNMLGFINPACL